MEKGFPEELIDEVKDRNNIVDVISEYIQVTQAGSSYKALCPFHNEKTPSFVINRDKQIYKCFGCGEGGDIIGFIMKIENLDFIEAVKLLANKANIEIKTEESSQEIKKHIKEKNLYYEINRKAGLYFYNNLTKRSNPAFQYLANRGLNRKMLASFGIGYAVNSWDNLINYLRKEGYKLEDIHKSGLIRPNKREGYYDYFRNRIMFPIFNVRGDVVGFGGRVLDDSLPKYLNSPETKIFNKSNTLYGLNFARKNIIDGQIILVEGYMDVIALNQAGFKNAVASLGTSLTKHHGRILKKYCDEVIICFDGDSAGTKATMKSVNVLNEIGCDFKIMLLPEKQDPDDFIKNNGKDKFKEEVKNSMNLIDYRIFLAKSMYSGNTMEDKVKLARKISEIIRAIKSPIEKEAYIEKVANDTGISKESIKLEVYNNFKDTHTKRKNNNKYTSNYKRNNKYIEMVPLMEQKGHIIAEKQLIKFMIIDNKSIQYILNKVSSEDFSVYSHQKIVEYLYNNIENTNKSHLKESLPEFKETINEILLTDTEYIKLDKTLEKYIINLKKYKLLYDIKKLEEVQSSITKDSNLTKEEVERKLLDIGMEIMKKNAEIQKLKA